MFVMASQLELFLPANNNTKVKKTLIVDREIFGVNFFCQLRRQWKLNMQKLIYDKRLEHVHVPHGEN